MSISGGGDDSHPWLHSDLFSKVIRGIKWYTDFGVCTFRPAERYIGWCKSPFRTLFLLAYRVQGPANYCTDYAVLQVPSLRVRSLSERFLHQILHMQWHHRESLALRYPCTFRDVSRQFHRSTIYLGATLARYRELSHRKSEGT